MMSTAIYWVANICSTGGLRRRPFPSAAPRLRKTGPFDYYVRTRKDPAVFGRYELIFTW